MAGYIFNLDSLDSLRACAERGFYSTRLSPPSSARGWSIPAEGTLADYVTMTPGDRVYFFIKRKIHGVGRLVAIESDCKFENFPGATSPHGFSYDEVRESLIDDAGMGSQNHRWVCAFVPAPSFFLHGVDMDDALASNPPAFRSLRAMWKRSFVKLDDEEAQALTDAILKANQLALAEPVEDLSVFPDKHATWHERAASLVSKGSYGLTTSEAVRACCDTDRLTHEMALEACLLDELSQEQGQAVAVFGRWDFLSHQVISSPFKPIDYMDRMDVFGYRFITEHRPTIANYLVAELKKDEAGADDVGQVLKYVDWVRDEYAHGDYSMIRAFLVAYDFDPGAIEYATTKVSRHFTVERRPPRTEEWSQLTLVRYRADPATGSVAFHPL